MIATRARSRWMARRRPGSALILVLVMTLSLAGLAISAVLLTSSSSLVQRYYDKEKDFRFYSRAAIALVKSTVQRDTTVSIPGDTAYRALTASTITDATGATDSTIKVNAYAGYTGDTAGTYIPFLTIMAQAYDTLGVRSVQRLDLRSEAFSRYAMFVDSFASNVSIQNGQYIRGRAHGNRNWVSTSTGPGPDYYDTVSAVGSVSGKASYHGIDSVTSAKRIKWPTTTALANLASLGSAGKLSFAPANAAYVSVCNTSPLVDLSGQDPSAMNGCWVWSSGFVPTLAYNGFAGNWVWNQKGSRLRFRPVDVNGNGTYDASEGFFEVFDAWYGIDTASLRGDMPRTSPGSVYNIVTLNQCGILATIGGRREFFPVARMREGWVRSRLKNSSTAPIISGADAGTGVGSLGESSGGNPTPAAVSKALSYGTGYSRCFPAGSPYLMLTERYVNGSCAIDSTQADITYGWGSSDAGCGAGQQYGGQDSTFTPNVTRCYIQGNKGQCKEGQVKLGSWRLFSSGGGTSTVPALTTIQDRERAYLWPIASTYNAASRGVIYSSGGPLFISDTLRGYATLYVNGDVVLINDLVYDKDPTASDALCRNFLGIIAAQGIRIANNGMNYPRVDPSSITRFLGTPNFTLDAITMALNGPVGVEDSTVAYAGMTIACNGTNTAGGCINQTGGAIMKMYRPTRTTTAGTGLLANGTADPCQTQERNRRPPFFPLTGRYVEYKHYDIDPQITSTWALIKTYLARLRGNNRKVP